MDTVQIAAGMIVRDDNGVQWRCFAIINRICRLIAMETSRFHFESIPLTQFNEMLIEGRLETVDVSNSLVVDRDRLPEYERERLEMRCSFINDVRKIYGPSFIEFERKCSKKDFVALYKQYGFAKSTAYKYLLRWLQSGLNYDSLVNKSITQPSIKPKNYGSKPGQKGTSEIYLNDELKRQFDYGIKLYRSGRIPSMELAFDSVILKYYTTVENETIVPFPPEKRPTIRQFRYYLSTIMGPNEIAIRKTSEREFENDRRALMGSAYDESLRPGFILESDAMEMDIECVSQFSSELNIGRPILYTLVDRYSHCIVAFHVGFDNNSMIGLTNLLVNLFDDRQTVLDKHHINMDLSLWPSPFIPEEIRCDRGSDYTSHGFETICKDLFILRTLEEGAKGSMKGMVERTFGLFNIMYNPFVEHKGLIQKRYDSNHHKEACLTIQAAYAMAALFVAYRNKTPMSKFKLTPDMIREGVDKSPISIWNYGVKHFGQPTPVTDANRDSVVFRLLPKEKATITREGVNLHGLIYQNNNDQDLIKAMIASKMNGNKRNTKGMKFNEMEVRYDPRSINYLYYEKEGKLEYLELVPSKNGRLHDITWDEYTKDYKEAIKVIDKKNMEKRLSIRLQAEDSLKEITTSVAKTFAINKDVKKNRRIEKNQVNFDNNLHDRLAGNNTDPEMEDQPKLEDETEIVDVTVVDSLPEDNGSKDENNEDKSKKSSMEKKTDIEHSLFSTECPEDLLI